ncbi:hypothetical protein LPJ70_007713, partial [Coemansia sp. RSA 2708]
PRAPRRPGAGLQAHPRRPRLQAVGCARRAQRVHAAPRGQGVPVPERRRPDQRLQDDADPGQQPAAVLEGRVLKGRVFETRVLEGRVLEIRVLETRVLETRVLQTRVETRAPAPRRRRWPHWPRRPLGRHQQLERLAQQPVAMGLRHRQRLEL